MNEQDAINNKVTLFMLLGTRFSATRNAWQFLLLMLVTGWGVAIVLNRAEGARSVIVLGLVYGLLILLAYLLHTVGHIISAREVNAPMTENILTAWRQINVYDERNYPHTVHVGRAIGGPLANLTAAGFLFVLWAFIPGWGTLVFACANLVIGVWSLLPLNGLDGAVLFRGSA